MKTILRYIFIATLGTLGTLIFGLFISKVLMATANKFESNLSTNGLIFLFYPCLAFCLMFFIKLSYYFFNIIIRSKDSNE